MIIDPDTVVQPWAVTAKVSATCEVEKGSEHTDRASRCNARISCNAYFEVVSGPYK